MRHFTGCARFWTVGVLTLAIGFCPAAQADVYQWLASPTYGVGTDHTAWYLQSTTVCPGGAGKNAVPGAGLNARDLTQAYLVGANVSTAMFSYSNLTNAAMANANLSGAKFLSATLTGADFTGATIAGADFQSTTPKGFTKEQLYSTASYISGDLHGINLSSYLGEYSTAVNVLSGWNFAGKNLSNATFNYAKLTGTNFAGATVAGAKFVSTTSIGFTKEQLYSTASYVSGDLSGMNLGYNALYNWNFAGKNLSGAAFTSSDLGGASFTGATIAGAGFRKTGLTREQLRSTLSYASGDLHGIGLSDTNLAGENFSGMNLSGVAFDSVNLQNATLYGVNFSAADLKGSDLRGAQGFAPSSASLAGVIQPDGKIKDLGVQRESTFVIRNHASVPVSFQNSAYLDWPYIWSEGSVPGGKLQFVLGEKPWCGPATFGPGVVPDFVGGTLEVICDRSSVPLIGWLDIPLFDWGAVPAGNRLFREVLVSVPWDISMDSSRLYTDGSVRLTSPVSAHAGDANGDGKVDVGDLGILGVNYGKTRGTGWMLGDFTGDGKVDVGDLGVLGVNYGYRAPAGAVPEPATLSLLAAGGLLLARRRARD